MANSTAGSMYVALRAPETAGRSLEDIEEFWRKREHRSAHTSHLAVG